MNYSFFDHKLFIEGFTSDLFCTAHIVFIVSVYVLGFFVSFLLRKSRHDRITVFLRVMSVVMVLLETAKITWESYYDVRFGDGFNYFGLLPLYTCSLFIYTLLAAAWGWGKVKECALSFITTIGLLYGAIGVVYCNGLNYYPFWTFGAFYSLIFHSTMFVTGVFLLMTKYKTLGFKDLFLPMIPIVLLALIAVPVNYSINSDYMLLYSAGGVPLYEPLAESLAEHGLRPVFTLIMLVTHIPLAGLVVGGYRLIRAAAKKISQKKTA